MNSKKVLSVLSGLCLAAALVPAAAFAADGETVNITDSKELIKAIQDQKAGQTWVLQAGDYNVSDDCLDVVANINGVEKGFVFPIFVDNLTIRGEGDVNITSDYNPGNPAGGAWNYQNFITIGGSNVTLENLDLKGNPNGYYGNQCNKVIELINGKDLTLKDLDLAPIEDSEGKVSSGSIYINVADAGNTVIEGVTMSSWINAKAVTAEGSTVTVKNTVQDFPTIPMPVTPTKLMDMLGIRASAAIRSISRTSRSKWTTTRTLSSKSPIT